MRKRTLVLFAVSLVAALVVFVGCSGGGGSSPTEPAPIFLNVQGSWSGIWVAPITVSAVFTQTGGNVTGTISSLGFTFDIRGTVSQGSPLDGTFSWEVVDGGCGTWVGQMQVSNGNRMSGDSRLSTLGCSNPDVIEGFMILTREGGAAASISSAAGSPGELQDLVKAVRR